jgi:hypothetical protein
VKHARLQVRGAPHQPEKLDDVVGVIRPVRRQRELHVRGLQHRGPRAAQIVQHLALLHVVPAVRIDAQQKLKREHLRLRARAIRAHPARRSVVVHVTQRGERLRELLHVQVAVVPVRVRDRRGLLAQLVLGEDREPRHLFQQPFREPVGDGLQRQVLAHRPQPVPQELALEHERHLRSVVQQAVQVRGGHRQRVARADHVRRHVVDDARVFLHRQRLVGGVAVVRISALEQFDVVLTHAQLALPRWTHQHARTDDVRSATAVLSAHHDVREVVFILLLLLLDHDILERAFPPGVRTGRGRLALTPTSTLPLTSGDPTGPR